MPIQFGTRFSTARLSGAAIGAARAARWRGLVAGVIGAVIGTLGGRAGARRLAAAFGRDRPAAFIEDAVAVGGAFLIAGGACDEVASTPSSSAPVRRVRRWPAG